MMRRALALARRGLGRTRPNPPVGAVLFKGGRVVGEGYHRRAGGPHAEIEALRAAGRRAAGAVLYVTLEPCSHTGRTPPCVDALAPVGLARIVVATLDPNPRVRGRGVARLRRLGVRVDVGQCATEARALIAGYRSWILRGRPRVVLKVAASLDGRIATRAGRARWITGPAARRRGRLLRGECDAVLVGSGTVRADDPRLTARLPGIADPIRVVLASRTLRIPLGARLFGGRGPTWVVVPRGASATRMAVLRARGVDVIEVPARGEWIGFPAVLDALGARGITQLLLEGGATVTTEALRAGVVDSIMWFVAPTLLGGDALAAVGALGVREVAGAPRVRVDHLERIGPDLLIHARPIVRR
jgi:diaminohydroxyphosphoribosylaminopyrimidine deaminase / 5-amino-6-(5-phosphoribosylamino)uracil reductase